MSSWKAGDKIISPFDEFLTIDMSGASFADTYRLMTSAIIPRPIAFVSTLSASGVANLAPFSYFNAVSSKPPCLMFAITNKGDGTKKDTLINIESQGEFVVNIVSEWLAEPMNWCSIEYLSSQSEFDDSGLTKLKSDIVAPFRVKESAIHFECRTYNISRIGGEELGGAAVVIGEIIKAHISRGLLDDKGRIDPKKVNPICRLAGGYYSTLGEIFELKRPNQLNKI